MEIKSVGFKGSTIFYKVFGIGQKIIFVHGFGEDGNIWQHQIDFLKNNYQLIIPDLPGSGESEFIENATIETYAETLKTIIDNELSDTPKNDDALSVKESKSYSITKNFFVEKVTIIGHSLGGYVALAFAKKYPEYLNGLGLFHSSAFEDDDSKKATRNKSIEFIKKNGAFAFLKTSVPGLFTKEFAQKNPEKINKLIEAGKHFKDETLIQYYEAMIKRPDSTSILINIDCPVLFIIGESDMAVPLHTSLQQAHLPKISFMHILFKSAHMGMWEEKEKANNILLDFMRNNLTVNHLLKTRF